MLKLLVLPFGANFPQWHNIFSRDYKKNRTIKKTNVLMTNPYAIILPLTDISFSQHITIHQIGSITKQLEQRNAESH